jgi:predicted nucleic acid-binding protein
MRAVGKVVEPIPAADYFAFKQAAMRRVAKRDPDDWPILATALFMKAPIWTEDRDFFGTGVATWTTHNVEAYLRSED